MVLEKLGESLRNSLNKIKNAVFVDEKLINEIVKEIQRALLQADINVKLVLELSKDIKKRISKDETKGLNKKEQLIKIVYEELVKFLGQERKEINISHKPTKIMMVGLYGSGKTTTTGKLAKYYTKRGNKVAVVGLDVWRPAAMKQLEQVAKTAGVDSYISDEKDPLKIWNDVKDKVEEYDIILIDTAGRDALNEELIKEIEAVTKAIDPQEKLLIISGDIGQAAQVQAQQFHDSCQITGIIATKMEGTAKGGGALTACAVTGTNIIFLGVGEKVDDLEPFNPPRFVSQMLGMGDIETLMEKAKEAMTEEDAEDLQKKLMKGNFSLRDLYDQMTAMKKMGPLGKIMDMIPGMAKIPKDLLEGQEEKMETWKFIMDSCTEFELEHPEELDTNRIERISKGAGVSNQDVRELLKQHKKSKKLMRALGGNEKKMNSMMKKMQSMGGQMPPV